MQSFGTSPSYTSSWGGVGSSASAATGAVGNGTSGSNGGIWTQATPIGSGMRSGGTAGDSGRMNGGHGHGARPAPLSSRALTTGEAERAEDSPMNGPEAKTGSGVLVATSESDDWSAGGNGGASNWRQPRSQVGGNRSAPLASGRSNQSNASPVRQRTDNARNTSPYFSPPQPSIFSGQGSAAATNSSNRSSLDPTSRSFFVSPQQTTSASSASGYQLLRRDSDDNGRRNPFGVSFGNLAPNGTMYSGYTSSAASRSGSLPPSRHGNDPQHQLGESGALQSNAQDSMYHRPNQSSRASTLSVNNGNSARFIEHQWPTNLHDLSTMTARMEVTRNSVDNSFGGYWEHDSAQIQAAAAALGTGSFAGGVSGSQTPNYSTQRNGSLSIDPNSRLPLDAMIQNGSGFSQQHSQHRRSQGEQSSVSPTNSDPRRNSESPSFFNGNTPPLPDHHPRGGFRAASGRNSFTTNTTLSLTNNQALLERKLRGLQEQQQQNGAPGNFLQSPPMGYPSPYPSVFDYSPRGAQQGQQQGRLNPQHLHFYQNLNAAGLPMGFAGPTPPQSAQPLSATHHNHHHHGPHVMGHSGHGHVQRVPPRGPAASAGTGTGDGGDSGMKLRSALLEDFKIHKNTKRYELKDIYEHVVEFSGDQHGSRFIQQKLETANSDEKAQLFKEILPNALQLMTDVFGNYVIQKFFEHGNQTQKKQLADKMRGHIAELSLQMYGCRVVQKAFEHILVDQQALLVKELENQVGKCVRDQNGNHVIQKAIQRIPEEHIAFIIDAFTGEVQALAVHPYGCRVVQRMLEHCRDAVKANILEELHACAPTLVTDQYGNYVTQHIIMHGGPSDRLKVIDLVTTNLLGYCKHKFASNVVEKSIQYGDREQRRRIIEIIAAPIQTNNAVGTLGANEGFTGVVEGETALPMLMRDQYGNYVIQKIMKVLHGAEYDSFIEKVRAPLDRAKKVVPFSKQVTQIDRLVQSGPAATLTGGATVASVGIEDTFGDNHDVDAFSRSRSSSQSLHQDKTRPPQLDISAAPTPPLMMSEGDAQSPETSSQPSTSNSTVDGPIGLNSDGEGAVSTPVRGRVMETKGVCTTEIEFEGDDTITTGKSKMKLASAADDSAGKA